MGCKNKGFPANKANNLYLRAIRFP
jgi:hypothetical protein